MNFCAAREKHVKISLELHELQGKDAHSEYVGGATKLALPILFISRWNI
jgi:hypothetical protein